MCKPSRHEPHQIGEPRPPGAALRSAGYPMASLGPRTSRSERDTPVFERPEVADMEHPDATAPWFPGNGYTQELASYPNG